MEINKPVIKQLIISKITLPCDMLYVIKEFAFEDVVSARSKYLKRIVDDVIENANCSQIIPYNANIWNDEPLYDPWNDDEDEEISPTLFVFWGEDDDEQFQCHYCLNCGNYTNIIEDDLPDRIKCKCEN
jgi:hypothetical protein